MLKQPTISTISAWEGQEVTLNGWVYHIRDMGKVWFLILRDGTGRLQCVVVKDQVDEDVFGLENTLTQESSVTVRGTIHSEPRAPGGFELAVASIRVHQVAQAYPITPKEHGTAFLMDHRHLWFRSRKQQALLRVRHQVARACREFFDGQGFVLLDTPIFTANAVEGTSSLFAVDYFERQAYLTQSGQLHAEAGAMAFGKVYCFGPTFRAEKSKTRRHLTEFWMVEPEMAYCDLEENMNWAEKLVLFIVHWILEHCPAELETLERDRSCLERIKAPFPRLTYAQAMEVLHKEGLDFEYGQDLGGNHETVISQRYDCPVMIHHWPVEAKAFYMKRDPDNPALALGVDMLAPEGYGEIIGGGQREDDYDTLVERIQEFDLPRKAFEWYLDLRRYGSVPHSGFGLGLERTVAWISGIQHLRESIPFPRTLTRLEP